MFRNMKFQMSTDFKGLLKYLGFIFISVFLSYKIPHDNYSIIQYVFRPIRLGGFVFYLSGIVPLAIFIIGVMGLCRLKWFAFKSKVLAFFIVLLLIAPIMKYSLDAIKAVYLLRSNTRLSSIDLRDADLMIINGTDTEATLDVKLTLTDYGKGTSNFKVRMYLPEPMKTWFDKDFIDFRTSYNTSGFHNKITVHEQITVQFANGFTADDIHNSNWYYEKYRFVLYNGIDSVQMIYHGI